MKGKESVEFILIYSLVCAVLWVAFTLLGRYIKNNGPICCDVVHTKLHLNGEYTCEIIATVAAWYGIGVVLTVSLRYIYNAWLGGTFHYYYFLPFTLAVGKWGIARLCLSCTSNKPDLKITRFHIWGLPGIIGITEDVEIITSNIGLMLCEVNFYTLTKNTTLFWTFFWSLVFKLEKCEPSLFAAVLPFCFATLLSLWMDSDGPHWNTLGFFVLSVASCAAGLRWTLVQKLKGVDQVYRRPMYCLYSFGPMAIMAITPFALYDIIRMIQSDEHIPILELLIITLSGGILAFLILLCEIHLTQITSSLTSSVLGSTKEIITIIVSFFVLNETMNAIQWIGVTIGVLSFCIYSIYRSVHISFEKGTSFEEIGDNFNDMLDNGLGRSDIFIPVEISSVASSEDLRGSEFY